MAAPKPGKIEQPKTRLVAHPGGKTAAKLTTPSAASPPYPGILEAMDGTGAVVAMETAASEAAGAYPITPSTQMGEGWAEAAAQGKLNVNGRKLIFFEPEGEHAAAAVTAGLSLVGLRSANFSSGQGIAYMHESLYAAVGKRLTYVLNIAARAMTKQALNIHCGHDDYHAVDDTGFFQLFAKNVQEAADLNLIAHRIAELALNPGICAQDGFLTSHVIEALLLPEPDLVREYLGSPDDVIDCPTPAQAMIFGEKRRRIPELFDLDHPAMLGVVQNQDSYAQGVAAQRPFFFDHIQELTDRAMAEYGSLSGRVYARATGYQSDDAELVIIGQGSVVPNAEAVCDYLRSRQGLKVGVINLTMFRPFPADLISSLVRGKKAVLVLERVDQPLAVDAPILREVRAAVLKAIENGRAEGDRPYPGIAAFNPADVPAFFSGCYGLGSRDLQPGDLIAAVRNMLPGGTQRRQFYLGIDFIRKGVQSEQLKKRQEDVLSRYPRVADLSLEPEENPNLLPPGSLAVRIHSVGGWGAITMGKNLSLMLFEQLGLRVKANPKYGSEKKGQPTTFYAVFGRAPIRLNCDLKYVDAVISPDPNVFLHSNPLAGLPEGGVFIVQSSEAPGILWRSLPAWARTAIRQKKLRVYQLDGFKIAQSEASDPGLRFRMQGAAFQGAFLHASPLLEREGVSEEKIFEGIRTQLEKKFGKRGAQVVEDNYRVIRRGFDEVIELDWTTLDAEKKEAPAPAHRPQWVPTGAETATGIDNPQTFFDRVCALYGAGQDPTADPATALSPIPAATGVLRDMTAIRMEVPILDPAKCTGCGQCWVQCPDAAIPGLVTEIDTLLNRGIDQVVNGEDYGRLRDIVKPLSDEIRRSLKNEPFINFRETLCKSYVQVVSQMGLAPKEREPLNSQFDRLASLMADFPLTCTSPFFTGPEKKKPGGGALLSITVNPYACKGCMLCVEVCPDDALSTQRQTREVVDQLQHNWALWQKLPDTPDPYLNVRDLNKGIGALHTLLLKKHNYRSMVGGDGACMGCGEKTAMHLIVSAVEAAMQDRVGKFVAKIDGLMAGMETKLSQVVEPDRMARLKALQDQLKDLRWRYTTGPTGQGRAALGMTNATGCSSVWGSTYPYNPYPYPWTNHLFQDAPSIAIGIFEGIMRKMADAFSAVRRVELELSDAYEPKSHASVFAAFDWTKFTDDEFLLCPPILAVGGDGAMLDIGFQNLSRLMASGKPLRVIVLDTQVYSNTGGQACTSSFTGQVADMAAYGSAQKGKQEQRKEMALLAIAHRTSYVLQSSQGIPSHLLAGVLKGLSSRRPAIFNIYTPCQPEHGVSDDGSMRAARLARDSRAFPHLIYDPDGGPNLADRLELTHNPSLADRWTTFEINYLDEKGNEQVLKMPLTIADWAATESRFARQFSPVMDKEDGLVPFHEYLNLSQADRAAKRPFIHALDAARHLKQLIASDTIVRLAEERLSLWSDLKEMAGLQISPKVRKRIETELAKAPAPAPQPKQEAPKQPAKTAGANGTAVEPAKAPQTQKTLSVPTIESELCTSCDECLNINPQLFAYNSDKQAIIKDLKSGTFQELVRAAETCPAGIIHPGLPLNPKEDNIDQWLKRAEPFNQA